MQSSCCYFWIWSLEILKKRQIFLVCFPLSEVQLGPSDSVSTVTEGDDAMVCIQVSSNGTLQRDIQVAVKTISTQTSTGEYITFFYSMV